MTVVMARLCACGHAPRLHEPDETGADSRGLCQQPACGCTEYRPTDTAVAAIGQPATPDPAPTWSCGDCGQTFDRPQALGSHRRYVHPKTAAAITGSPSPEPKTPQAGTEAPAVPPAAGDLAPHAKTGPTVDDHQVEVDRDDVLVGLVRALEVVVDMPPSEMLEQAIEIRRYMDDRGWRVTASPERAAE